MKKLLYLDVYALSRPFDDQSYLRIRLKTEAINLILARIKENFYEMMVSPVHIKEILGIEDDIERIQLITLLNKCDKKIGVDLKRAKDRAEELVK